MIHPEANNEELNMVQLDLRNIMILNEILTQRRIEMNFLYLICQISEMLS